MRIEDPEGRTYHGKVGNMIYYSRGGKTYARRASKPGNAGKKKKRSGTQRALSERFRAMQMLYKFYREQVSAEIWRIAGAERGMMAHNLFHAENYRCVDGEGRMAAPEAFRFSEGSLLLPWDMAVESLGGGLFRATWREDREGATAAGTDRLRAGVLYDSAPMSTRPAEEASGTRGGGGGEFRLDEARGRAAHVYLYFEREDGRAFSPSRHFRVEW